MPESAERRGPEPGSPGTGTGGRKGQGGCLNCWSAEGLKYCPNWLLQDPQRYEYSYHGVILLQISTIVITKS